MMRAAMLVVSMIIIAHAVWAAAPAKVDALFANIAPSSPGAAVVVIKDGRAVFQRGYGVTDLRTLHRIDEHTNFRLASVTKKGARLLTIDSVTGTHHNSPSSPPTERPSPFAIS